MWSISEGQLTATGLTRRLIRKATTETDPTGTDQLSRTTQTSITRTGIRSRTLLIDIPMPGLIPLIVMTDTGTASRIDATGCGFEFGCDSLRGNWVSLR